MLKRFLVLSAAGLMIASLGLADDDDPPSRAARLSYLNGTVSFQPGSVEDWVPAALNRPMTTGDRLWTEAGARAEMALGSAALRLNGRTNFAFLNLDDRITQIQLSVGTLSVRVRNLNDDESFEIDTPQLALTILRPGEYRVDVDEQGDTTIVGVRGGDAEATAGGQSVAVRARQQLRATGTDRPIFDTRDIPPADNFDNFCSNRDRRQDLSQSALHVSRDIPGYEDLDNTGVWRQVPDYGWVWAPTVQVDWAPYHYGHWAWISPWGWTWVDDAPWGYAPFHYGRWVNVGGWAWVPGPIVARPVYAPAMVAWVGGANFGVGIAVGGGPAVGWFPLGPREVWTPSYRHSQAYVERVNVTNTVIVNRTTINNINVNNVTYVNRNVAGAVTVVPQNQMIAGRPVAAASIRVAPAALARAEVRPMAAAAPDRGAVLGGRNAGAPAPPPSVMSRQVLAVQTAPQAPVPFTRQQQALQQNPGQPIPRSTLNQIQQSSPGQAPRPFVRQVGPQGGVPQRGVPVQAGTPQVAPPQQRGVQNNPLQPNAAQPVTPQPDFRRGQQNNTPAPNVAPQATPQQAQPDFRRGQQNNPLQPNTAQPVTPQQPDSRRGQPNNTPAPNVAPQATPQQAQPDFRRGQQNNPLQPNTAQPVTPQQPDSRRGQPNNTPAPNVAPPATPQQAQPDFRRGQQNGPLQPNTAQPAPAPQPQPQPEVRRAPQNAPQAVPQQQPEFHRGQQAAPAAPPPAQAAPEVRREAPPSAPPQQRGNPQRDPRPRPEDKKRTDKSDDKGR